MSLDRRSFFKTLGVAGFTLAAGDLLAGRYDENAQVEFNGILYDSTRCIGCRACEMACAESHGFPEPTEEPAVGLVRKPTEVHRTVINKFSTSKGEVFAKNQCMHCNQPACVAACLTKAMYKTPEGPVIWRGDKCMGCRYCMVSCPFDVPKFEYHSANPEIQKCDMCYNRIREGQIPACAEICGDALMFGSRRELIAEARKRFAESPGDYTDQIYGEFTAGGTGFMYIGQVPFNEIGLNTSLQNSSYPALTKGFLYSVPAVFVLLPSLLLGIHEATRTKQPKEEENE